MFSGKGWKPQAQGQEVDALGANTSLNVSLRLLR